MIFQRRHIAALLHVADSMLCMLVFFPSMLMYWRGIWDLLSVYVLPDQVPTNYWVTTGIGASCIIGYFVQPWMQPPRRWRLLYEVACRGYMYVYAAFLMAYWRGVWTVADHYLLEFGWQGGAVGLAICCTVIVALKSCRSLIFPPFSVCLDTRKERLVPATRFQVQPSRDRPMSLLTYTADSFFTQFFIITLTILSWRSALTILDTLPYPVDGDLFCFTVGGVACIVLFAMEELFAMLLLRLESWWSRLIWNDVVYLVVFCSETFLWRGGWNLNTRYMISDPEVGGWVNFGTGSALLLTLQLLSYVGFCGCSMDSTLPGREDIYSTRYLRHFVSLEQTLTRNSADVEDNLSGSENSFKRTDNEAGPET